MSLPLCSTLNILNHLIVRGVRLIVVDGSSAAKVVGIATGLIILQTRPSGLILGAALLDDTSFLRKPLAMRAPSPPIETKGHQRRSKEHHEGPRLPSGLRIDVGIDFVQSVHLQTDEDGTKESEDDPEPHDGQDAPWPIPPAGFGLREAGKVVFDIGLRLARPRKAGQNTDRHLLAAEGLIRSHFLGNNVSSIAVGASSDTICDRVGMAVRDDGIFRREALPKGAEELKIAAGSVLDISNDCL